MTEAARKVPFRVDLPEEFVRMLGCEEAAVSGELKRLAAMELVRSGRLAFTRAAELLGMSQGDFIQYLSDHAVSVLHYDDEELNREVDRRL